MNYNNDDGTNNNNNINDQPLFPFMPNREQIRSFKRTIPVAVYDFYISGEIKESDAYMEMIHTLKSADPQDTIFIYLNTPGGDLYTTIQILAAMNSSQAKVITCLEGQACSAGTFIFLKGDTKIVNPNCTFMVHNYSQGASGKGNEVVLHVNYMERYFQRLAEDVYSEFLNAAEMEHVVSGDDLWMDSYDVVRRLDEYDHEYVYTGLNLEEILGREELDKAQLNTSVDTEPEILKTAKKPPAKKKASKKRASKKRATKRAAAKKKVD